MKPGAHPGASISFCVSSKKTFWNRGTKPIVRNARESTLEAVGNTWKKIQMLMLEIMKAIAKIAAGFFSAAAGLISSSKTIKNN